MLSKLELIINGTYSLWLPAEGIDITLLKNEFNLLTSDTAANRPLSITETFELPLDENRRVFEQLRGRAKRCELRYNDVVLIAGPISEYSVDEQRKKILVTITSAFKDVVDYMGDNLLYLDAIDLSRWDYTVGAFARPEPEPEPGRTPVLVIRQDADNGYANGIKLDLDWTRVKQLRLVAGADTSKNPGTGCGLFYGWCGARCRRNPSVYCNQYSTPASRISAVGFTGEVTLAPNYLLTEYLTPELKTLTVTLGQAQEATDPVFFGGHIAEGSSKTLRVKELEITGWNDTPVCKLVPVAEGALTATGKTAPGNCFWDSVTDRFYENVSTGAFLIEYEDTPQVLGAPEPEPEPEKPPLLRFGYYNPMDTATGSIAFTTQNIDDYCKPSLNLREYFQEVFRRNGWTAGWDAWSETMRQVCLLPTTVYQVSSWGFSLDGLSCEIPAGGEYKIPLDAQALKWNVTKPVLGVPVPGCELLAGGSVQPRQPNRVTSFKIKALYTAQEAFGIVLREGAREMACLQSLGGDTVSYVTDSVNLQEGIDPLSLVLVNPNPYPVGVEFGKLDFYNLFSIYETNDDGFEPPQGYRFPVADNFPKLTPLEVYRELLTLFQMAQTSDDGLQEVDFYYLNDIPKQDFERVDVSPYLFWDGYTILSDKINGLAKLNAIRYKDDTKRARYFRVDIAPLPASATYFESRFAHGVTVPGWKAVSIPALKYKVKTAGDGIPTEYLEFVETGPQLGCYDEASGAMVFEPLHISRIVGEYWSGFLPFLSSSDGYDPVVYKLRLRLYFYQYLELFGQRRLFYYNNDALLLDGSYDVINQTFEGTFISLR